MVPLARMGLLAQAITNDDQTQELEWKQFVRSRLSVSHSFETRVFRVLEYSCDKYNYIVCAPLSFKKIDKLPYLASWALLSSLFLFLTSIDLVNNGFERHKWLGCHGLPNWKHYLLLHILVFWLKFAFRMTMNAPKSEILFC